MFTVSGYINGVSYRAVVGGVPGDPDLTAGCVTGDPGVIGLLRDQAGEPWQATPTGPSGILDLADPASVLGALMDHTDITGIDGNAPDLIGPAVPGAVY